MKWTHLPVAGGLYDQHPKLIDDFELIMGVEAMVEKRKRAKEKNAKMGSGRGRPR